MSRGILRRWTQVGLAIGAIGLFLAACAGPAGARAIPDHLLTDEPPRPWHGVPIPDIHLHKEFWAEHYGLTGEHLRETTDPDTSGFDALHVELIAEPIIAEEGIVGSVRWTLQLTDPTPSPICFDFFSNMTITEVLVDAQPAEYTHEDDRLCITPAPGEGGLRTTIVEIAYEGIPEMGFIWGYDVRYHGDDDVPIVYTNCEPSASRTWWPCKDRPDDKFTADISFIVPDTLIAASNGTLVEVIPQIGGRMLYHWRENYPITTYLVSLAATNYTIFTDEYVTATGHLMPLTYYAYPEDLDRAMADWAITPAAIALFEDLFAPYPFPEEKYGMAEYPWSGAMEHQTLSSMGDYFFLLPDRSEWVVVHELAHQWWGDWVTCADWRDIWLHEGFATYCEALWAEHISGPDGLHEVMESKKSDEFHGPVYDPNFIFSGTVYRKGAWVLHMLRHIMGDETFFGALQAFGDRHAYGNVVTSELQSVVEEFWGESLDWFFDEWVYEPGRPGYAAHWSPLETLPDGTTLNEIRIIQTTTGPDYFKMPIDAEFPLPGGEVFEFVLWDSLPEQTWLIKTPAPPDTLRLDPYHWILADVEYIAGPVAVDDEWGEAGAGALLLRSPQPNPTSGLTHLQAHWNPEALAAAGRCAADLRLEIVDLTGRVVRRLPLSEAGSDIGTFTWDGRGSEGEPVPAGLYWAALRADGQTPLLAGASQRRKILRLR